MLGQMMNQPLMVSSIIKHAARNHGDQQIVSRSVEGPIHRYTYRDAHARMKQLANALRHLGINCGDRVATLAWNTYRHVELYYAISGTGAVCHTINPRLFAEQLIYIVNHAADRYIFVDLSFVPILEQLHTELRQIEGYVLMTDRAHMPETTLPNVLCYEELLSAQSDDYEWPTFDENNAAMLCYTSGTTGNPKGALYSHRSTLLHALCAVASTGKVATSSTDTFLAIVPMFHVAAWGNAYSVPIAGGKLVLPGARYDGASLFELMDTETVTTTAGVPTIVTTLLDEMRKQGRKPDGLANMLCGGSAPSRALIQAFEGDYGVNFSQGWGMTETSPIAAVNVPRKSHASLDDDARYDMKLKCGYPNFGVEAKIVSDAGERLAEDGVTTGQLGVRGPYIISGYYNDEEATAAVMDADGWFLTGDVASIDADGYILLTDRSKDLIKSGGEWISSIDLENTVMSHNAVAEAAAIACHHPKWEERPLLVIVLREGENADKQDILDYLKGKIAKWWMPDDIVFVDELPHGATGKVSKLELRKKYADYKLPTT
jgi:acyl-CoA synthetase (AMP-forming)/AMP-acid ligase II